MKALKALLPSDYQPTPLADDELCHRCGELNTHDCCECRGGGRVRVNLDRHDPEFGKSIPCPSCHGKRYVGPTIDEYLRRARVPRRFQNCAWGSWDLTIYTGKGNPKARCAEWIAAWPPEKPVLALFGARGSGKTTLAFATLRAAFENFGIMALAWNCADLMGRYRATMGDGATETEGQIDHELEIARLLLLDDYGAQQDTEWAQSKLYGVINRRYNAGTPLIVTSNATLTMDRTLSRLVDVQSSVAVQFDGKDVREG